MPSPGVFFAPKSTLRDNRLAAIFVNMMPSRTRERAETASFGQYAEENLRFIRRTMERSSTFTAVPGLGGAGMGVIGLAGAVVAANQRSPERWLVVWLLAAAVALVVGVITMWRKAARSGAPLAGAVGRRFAMSLAAPLVAGAALTWGVWMRGDRSLIPAVWLLLYGTGVLTGGVFSVAAVRLLGVACMTLGIAALVTPAAWGDVWLGMGFGGLQLVFGLYIAARHGG
jgi:hypothetical protein